MTASAPFSALTAAPPAALPAGSLGADDEPSRFAAYAAGIDPAPAGGVERVLAMIERVLVPGLRNHV